MSSRFPRTSCARSFHPVLFTLLLTGACSAPREKPVEAPALVAGITARGTDPERLAETLAALELEPLGLRVPDRAGLVDPELHADQSAPWHTIALAFEARTRAARHALLAARREARAAGSPMPTRAMLEVEELDEPDAYARMTLTVDLLGLLGLGPAGAARELADARVRRALGELELAAWDARVGVDRARARLAAVRTQAVALRSLLADAHGDGQRIEVLARHGRLAAQDLAAADSALGRLRKELFALEGEEAEARAALAVAAGIAPASPCLDALGAGTLSDLEGRTPGEPPVPALWASRSPALRLGLLEYAVAEAEVREAAAARWPSFELGPHLLWRADELFTGVVTGTSIPWPGAVQGPLRAALERREAARSALEDEWLATLNEARAAQDRCRVVREGLEPEARAVDSRAQTAWSAARARFGIEPGALMEWAAALDMRAEATMALTRARLAGIEAALDLERLVGPGRDDGSPRGSLARGEVAR